VITVQQSAYSLEIKDSGLLFSSSLLIDSINKTVAVHQRSWLFFSKSAIYRFDDMDYLNVEVREPPPIKIIVDDDFADNVGPTYCLELTDKKLVPVWWCEIYYNEDLFKAISKALCDRLGIDFQRKPLVQNSVICRFCRRTISKVAERCIYCGKPQGVDKPAGIRGATLTKEK
jgi:hypothetical protein